MNTRLIVKKTADANYKPVKFAIVEMTPGASAGVTYCLLSTIDVGYDTEGNWDLWRATKSPDGIYSNPGGRDPVGHVGTIGALEVVALSTLEAYTPFRPSMDRHA